MPDGRIRSIAQLPGLRYVPVLLILIAGLAFLAVREWSTSSPKRIRINDIRATFRRAGFEISPDALIGHRPGTITDFGFRSLPNGTPILSTVVDYATSAQAQTAARSSLGPTVRRNNIVLFMSVSDSARTRRLLADATRKLGR